MPYRPRNSAHGEPDIKAKEKQEGCTAFSHDTSLRTEQERWEHVCTTDVSMMFTITVSYTQQNIVTGAVLLQRDIELYNFTRLNTHRYCIINTDIQFTKWLHGNYLKIPFVFCQNI